MARHKSTYYVHLCVIIHPSIKHQPLLPLPPSDIPACIAQILVHDNTR